MLFVIDDRQDPYHGYLEIARDIPRKVRVELLIKNMPIDRE